MIFRTFDEKNTFPDCHRGNEGASEVKYVAASYTDGGHIHMMVSPRTLTGEWGAISVFMSPGEAKKLACDLLMAAIEVEPYYAS